MSKPDIYGFCKAGCKWPTVHKSDFDAAASFVKVDVQTTTELYTGVAYRIVYQEGILNRVYFEYTIPSLSDEVHQINIVYNPTYLSYRPYVQVRICEVAAYPNDDGDQCIKIVYELDGQVLEQDLIVGQGQYEISIPDKPLKVLNAEEIYQYNDFGNLRLDVNISDFVSLNDIGYEEPVGVFDPVEFTYYCSNFKRGTVVKLTKQDVASGLYPNLYAFLETCPEGPKTDYYYDLEIVNNRDDDNYGCVRYIVKMVNSANENVCYEYTTRWTKVYPVESNELTLEGVGYTEPADDFNPNLFKTYCSNLPNGARLLLTAETMDSATYPKLNAFLSTCPEGPEDAAEFSLEIINAASDSASLIHYIYRFSNGNDMCYEYTYEWNKVYPVVTTIKAPLLVGDNLKGKTLYFDTTVTDPFDLGTIEWDVSNTILEIEQDNIYININGTQTVLYDGGWQVSSITFPTDKDYIVATLNGDGVDIVRTDKSQQDAYDTLLKKAKQTVVTEITQVLDGDY